MRVDIIASFGGLVAGKAFFVQGLIAGFAVLRIGILLPNFRVLPFP